MPEEPNPPNQIDLLTVGELISLKEAAEISGVGYNAIRGYARKGRLKAKKLGRDWFTTKAAIEEYLESRQQGKRTDLLTKNH